MFYVTRNSRQSRMLITILKTVILRKSNLKIMLGSSEAFVTIVMQTNLNFLTMKERCIREKAMTLQSDIFPDLNLNVHIKEHHVPKNSKQFNCENYDLEFHRKYHLLLRHKHFTVHSEEIGSVQTL